MRSSTWTDEEIEFLRQHAHEFTAKELIERLNRPEGTVKHKIRELGLDWKRTKRVENWDREIQALWADHTPKEIAENLGIPKGSVYSAAKRLGLTISEPNRPPELYRKAQAASSAVQRENSRQRALEKFGSWTPVSAYVFGVLWADGWLHSAGVGFGVAVEDQEWAEKIGRWLDPDIRISTRQVETDGKLYGVVE